MGRDKGTLATSVRAGSLTLRDVAVDLGQSGKS